MNKIFISLLMVATGSMIASSCAPSLKVTSDYDKSADFKQYKTFNVYTPESKSPADKPPISQLNQNRIYAAVKANMASKGFMEASDPDLMVNVVTILKDMQSVSANTNYYGYGGYYRPYGWGGGGMASGYTTYDVQNYKNGSLIIEVVDIKSKKLVWEGIGNKDIDAPLTDPDTQIPAAVDKIMTGFPPGATAKK